MQNVKTKLALVAASFAPVVAFAADESAVASIQSAITTNIASATLITTAAGLGLIGLAFLSFVFGIGRRAARGRS